MNVMGAAWIITVVLILLAVWFDGPDDDE